MSADAGSSREFVVLGPSPVEVGKYAWPQWIERRAVGLSEAEAIETVAAQHGAGVYVAIPSANFRERRVEMVPKVDPPERLDRGDGEA